MATSTLTIQTIQGKAPEGANVFKPYGGCREALYSHDKEVLVEGSAGTGKSRLILEKLHICAMKYPKMRGAIVRKTRESLSQTAMMTFETKVLPHPLVAPFNTVDQEYRYPNGSVIMVAGLDKETRIMSTDLDIIYPQEATELLEADWEALSTRLRNYVMPYQQIIGDCNPDAPGHWLNQRCIRGDVTRIQTHHEDNPVLFDHEKNDWTPEGRDYIATLERLTGARYKRLRLGLWVGSEGAFFPEWDEDVHLCEPFEIPANWTRWTSTDWGFADPWCTLWAARNPADKYHIYIYREAYGTGLRDEQQREQIMKLCNGERFSLHGGDPSMFNNRKESNRPSIAWVYWNHGKGIRLVPSMNDRIAGWQIVRNALAWEPETRNPRLQIMRGRAPNLVRTLPQMVSDPLDSEDLADKIRGAKTEDHPADTLRYLLVLESMPEEQRVQQRSFQVVPG